MRLEFIGVTRASSNHQREALVIVMFPARERLAWIGPRAWSAT
jgi:hypothetical protein